MNYANDIRDLIGNTPLIKLQRSSAISGALVLGKCEFLNPTHSIKDRAAYAMIERAIERGDLRENGIIIEPTSGNTGIALAAICATMGIKIILTMPESMSLERRKLLLALGASIVLTPANEGMNGAIRAAKNLQKETKNSIVLDQFSNIANPLIHEQTTALEIWQDMDGKVDNFVCSVGTGGTLSGTAKILKAKNPYLRAFAVEPAESAVLSGCEAGVHKIQGIGAGFIPQILDVKIYDEIIKVNSSDAIEMARLLAREEGLLVGISSGANVWAATEVAKRFPKQSVVTVLCDSGERYLSTEIYDK